MSTVDTKRSHAQALAAAEAFRDLFPSRCYQRWEFAGSLRRRKSEVGDIEHVIIPSFQTRPVAGDLFGRTEEVNEIWLKVDYLRGQGSIAQHIYSDGAPRWGERYRGVEFEGFNHEIFLATPDNFGCIFTIRTGPAEFSQRLMVQLRENNYRQDGGYLWTLATDPKTKIAVPDEETYFKCCGEAWKEPVARIR